MSEKRISVRQKADAIRDLRCKNLIAVLENPKDQRNIGSFLRNVNALGVEKAYIVTNHLWSGKSWIDLRENRALMGTSASAVKWTFFRIFRDSASAFDHLERKDFVSVATSPHVKGKITYSLDNCDFTRAKRLAVWFGTEGSGLSDLALERCAWSVAIPMAGIIESFNLGTSSGIVLYEATRQRRAFQEARRRLQLSAMRV